MIRGAICSCPPSGRWLCLSGVLGYKATEAPGGPCDMGPHGLPVRVLLLTLLRVPPRGVPLSLPTRGRRGLLLELSGLPSLLHARAGRVPWVLLGGRSCCRHTGLVPGGGCVWWVCLVGGSAAGNLRCNRWG